MRLETVIPFDYDAIHFLDRKTVSVCRDLETAVFDLEGRMVLPFESDLHALAHKALAFVQPISAFLPFVTYSANHHQHHLYPQDYFFRRDHEWIVLKPSQRDGRWGVTDHLGRVIVPFEYRDVYIMQGDAIRVMDDHHRYGLYDYHGNALFPCRYRIIFPIDDYYAVNLIENTNYGVLDRAGRELLPFIFDDIEYLHDPGGYIIPEIYNNPGRGVFRVKGEWKGFYTDLEAKAFLIPDPLARAHRIYFRERDRHWLGDLEGNRWPLADMYCEVYGCRDYYHVRKPTGFEGGIPYLSVEDRCGILDGFGKPVIPCMYEEIIVHGDSEDPCYFPVLVDGKWGLIDVQNRMVIAPRYDEMLPCYHGTIPVRVGEHWGLIAPSGEEILPCRYAEIGERDTVGRRYKRYESSHVHGGQVISVSEEKHGLLALVDLNGRFLSGFEFRHVHPCSEFHEGLLLLCRDGNWGMVRVVES